MRALLYVTALIVVPACWSKIIELSDIEVEYAGFFRDTILNKHYHNNKGLIDGSATDIATHNGAARQLTLTGQRRMDHFVAIIATIVEDEIPGSIIETGVWRGGMSFMAAKALDILKDKDRTVYLSDSFEGIPDPTQYGDKAHPHDVKKNPHHYSSLNENSVDRVKRDGAMFGISASRVSYVVGYFKDSLPQLIKNEPNIQFAAVRLDGDTYWSTMEAIEVLYPRLSPGGFLVIDDFTDWDSCRDAIYDYRKKYGITENIFLVPHLTENGEYIRGAYWRKSKKGTNIRGSTYAECLGAPKGSLRLSGSYNPSHPTQLTKHEATSYQGKTLTWVNDSDVIIYRCDLDVAK